MTGPLKRKLCPLCGKAVPAGVLTESDWIYRDLWKYLLRKTRQKKAPPGACAACVQEALLLVRLKHGEEALQESIQTVWPLDAEAAFGAVPTPLRMHADPRYTGKGVTIAFLDSGFYPHLDLTRPENRIRAWIDVSQKQTVVKYFQKKEAPRWPGWNDRAAYQWHGMMTSSVAAGNGWLSHGLYRGLAACAELVLIQIAGAAGKIDNSGILCGLEWIEKNGADLNIKVVNVSVGGDAEYSLAGNALDKAVERLAGMEMTVVVAAGNQGQRRLAPPATSPFALTIGGIDDKNTFDRDEIELWHSDYGKVGGVFSKPELVAPSIWLAAPMLPKTPTSREAVRLFRRRKRGENVQRQLLEAKLITRHYKHVDGTSFAAPIISSVIACMLEANRSLSADRIKELLLKSAVPVPGALPERQGAGVLDAGNAIALAVWDRKVILAETELPPIIGEREITYLLHDSEALQVEVFGSWNNWRRPGIRARQKEPAVWHAVQPLLSPGRYWYKFRINGKQWMDDPANPRKSIDRNGRINSILIVP